jgi:carbon-monoxide dehydrogenase medium subunit
MFTDDAAVHAQAREANMLVGQRSRKHIPSFDLVRPASVEEACRALAAPGRNVVMAGGLDLIDRLKGGEAVDRIIHLAGVRELSGIRRDGSTITIGALTTHAQIAHSALLADLLPDFPAIWRTIANPRVRLVGTLGGNLMSAAPHYDAGPALLALGADAVVFDRSGTLAVVDLPSLRDRDDMILGQVRIGAASFRRRLLADRSLHPIVSVYLGASIDNGTVRSARIVAGCAHAQAVMTELPVAGMPAATLGSNAGDLAHVAAGSLPEPVDDGLASGSYRRRMIEVLARRLLIKLGSRP